MGRLARRSIRVIVISSGAKRSRNLLLLIIMRDVSTPLDMTREVRGRLTLLFDQICELVEKVRGIMGTRRGFGVILDAENRKVVVPHPLDRAVV